LQTYCLSSGADNDISNKPSSGQKQAENVSLLDLLEANGIPASTIWKSVTFCFAVTAGLLYALREPH
jgi:hypothetical protein